MAQILGIVSTRSTCEREKERKLVVSCRECMQSDWHVSLKCRLAYLAYNQKPQTKRSELKCVGRRSFVDMCQAASTTPTLNTHVEFPTAVSIRKASLRQVSTRWNKYYSSSVHDSRAPLLEGQFSAQDRRPASGQKACKRKGRPIQYTVQYFSLYANESRIETSALSKRYIHAKKTWKRSGDAYRHCEHGRK
jgi:hypothetical protein